ncbi:MAG: DUF2116 family Zn-ribbon domain-containing protein [Bacteroidales bacterium]|nr:DUF2116 family Zn-ribbon domain-containing protein [Bacteroidales bacterium]
MEKQRYCLNCGAPLYGRPDKLFCSDRCKDSWHNIRRSRIRKKRSSVMSILDNNHEILAALLRTGRTVWITPLVEAMGFRWDYFTRLVEIKHGSILCECFDIRYRVSKTKLSSLARVSEYQGDKPQERAQISSAERS